MGNSPAQISHSCTVQLALLHSCGEQGHKDIVTENKWSKRPANSLRESPAPALCHWEQLKQKTGQLTTWESSSSSLSLRTTEAKDRPTHYVRVQLQLIVTENNWSKRPANSLRESPAPALCHWEQLKQKTGQLTTWESSSSSLSLRTTEAKDRPTHYVRVQLQLFVTENNWSKRPANSLRESPAPAHCHWEQLKQKTGQLTTWESSSSSLSLRTTEAKDRPTHYVRVQLQLIVTENNWSKRPANSLRESPAPALCHWEQMKQKTGQLTTWESSSSSLSLRTTEAKDRPTHYVRVQLQLFVTENNWSKRPANSLRESPAPAHCHWEQLKQKTGQLTTWESSSSSLSLRTTEAKDRPTHYVRVQLQLIVTENNWSKRPANSLRESPAPALCHWEQLKQKTGQLTTWESSSSSLSLRTTEAKDRPTHYVRVQLQLFVTENNWSKRPANSLRESPAPALCHWEQLKQKTGQLTTWESSSSSLSLRTNEAKDRPTHYVRVQLQLFVHTAL